jgi:3-oxoacyl-[acyl-carrier-protein] synthase II
MGRRVAITGAGVISPLGNNLRDFYRALAEARPGIRRLPTEVAQGSGVQVGALVDWNPAPMFKQAEASNIDRASQFALAWACTGERAWAVRPPSKAPISSFTGRASGGCGPLP